MTKGAPCPRDRLRFGCSQRFILIVIFEAMGRRQQQLCAILRDRDQLKKRDGTAGVL